MESVGAAGSVRTRGTVVPGPTVGSNSLSLFRWPPLLMICHLMRALQQLLTYSCLVGPFLSLHKLCSDLIFQSFSFMSQNLCNHVWFMLNCLLIYTLCGGLLSYTEVRAVQSSLSIGRVLLIHRAQLGVIHQLCNAMFHWIGPPYPLTY